MCRRARGYGKHAPEGSTLLKYGKDTGYMQYVDGVLHIVIDGSDNFVEWLLNALWVRVGKFKEAFGFRVAAVGLYEDITEVLGSADPQIVIMGHSRGGAIANSLGLIMKNRDWDVVNVVTFGAPKVGGGKFVKACKKAGLRLTRVFAKGDIVSTLPFIRGRHFETIRLKLKNNIRGVVKTHLGYGAILKELIDA